MDDQFLIYILRMKGIQLGMDIDEILKGDLELFEVSGVPGKSIPKQARESAQNQVKLIVILV